MHIVQTSYKLAQKTIGRRSFLRAGALCGLALPSLGPINCLDSENTGPVLFAKDLGFPEGPIALNDGSLIVSEIAYGRLARVFPDGEKHIVAEPGGGPNGNAIGPDGALYNCNNDGFEWTETDGLMFPTVRARNYRGGHIDRIDLKSGQVTELYRTTDDGEALEAPNDIVFDSTGCFWATDYGSTTDSSHSYGGIYYGRPDGSSLTKVVGGMLGCNGIALSPDETTLYVATTLERQILAFDVASPGKLSPTGPFKGRVIASFDGRHYLDSLKIDQEGNILVAVIVDGSFTAIAPSGERLQSIPIEDAIPTSLCFSPEDLSTVFLLGGTTGRIFRAHWSVPGISPLFEASL